MPDIVGMTAERKEHFFMHLNEAKQATCQLIAEVKAVTSIMSLSKSNDSAGILLDF